MTSMPKIEKELINKLIIALIFIALAYFSFVIIQGFIVPIFIGTVIAYAIYPVHKRLIKRTRSERMTAVILGIVALFILTSLAFILIPEMLREVGKLVTIYENILPQQLEELKNCSADSGDLKCMLLMHATKYVDQATLTQILPMLIKPVSEFVVNTLVGFFRNLPGLFLQITIILFSTIYFLHNGKNIVDASLKTVPMKDGHKKRIIERIDEVMKAVVYGNILTAFIEGVLATTVLLLLGVNMAFIAGLFVMFFALIPPLGAAIVWAPMAVALFLLNQPTEALIFGGACLLFMGYIDNIARPMIIGRKVRLSPFWVLLGVLGGIAAFGFAGIILGPLILSLFVTIMKILGEELIQEEDGRA